MLRQLGLACVVGALVVFGVACSSSGDGGHDASPRSSTTRGVEPGAARQATGTATTDVREDDLLLRPDGLGTVAFGASPSAVVTRLTSFLGPPDSDSGWQRSFGAFGTCPGSRARGVRWGRLRVLFSDGPTPWGKAGTEHFFAWDYSPSLAGGAATPVLHTASGVTVGTTVDDLRRIYGRRASLDAGGDRPSFTLEGLPAPQQFGGYLSGAAGQAVDWLYGGAVCGE